MKKMLKLGGAAAASAAVLFALPGCRREQRDGRIRVEQPWVRLPASKSLPGAAYFRLEGAEEGTRLVGLTSPLVRWVEMHESSTKGGMTGMKQHKEMEFSSRGELVFEPGGNHAMLYGIDPQVKPGGRIAFTFSFNVAPPLTIEAEVRAAGDPAPAER
ncbi:MAG TPA: copper chaperone PCu(A)C [Allosphingosinicella sp.]|jgi:hypothetical protein